MDRLKTAWDATSRKVVALWRRFRSWKLWQQGAAVLVVLGLLCWLVSLFSGGAPVSSENVLPTVSVAEVGSLSGSGTGVNVVGTVRSESEANILAESSGTVVAVHAVLGQAVPAGYAIAELENASQAAAVLQAKGAYDAAVAARGAASLPEAKTSAVDTYQTAYVTLDTDFQNYIDAFFGTPTSYGPALKISAGAEADTTGLSRRRADFDTVMAAWQADLPNAASEDPQALLDKAFTTTQSVSVFLNDLARVANDRASGATVEQLAALSTARGSVTTLLATISAARTTYRSSSTGATAGADASVETALGALRGAQANFEKTIVRAPIGGSVNFLSVHTGDYVTTLTHVATVAQNGALEIILNVSGDNRNALTVGGKVRIEGGGTGVITSISPALNPETKQIEVHVAVTDGTNLENGESVGVTFADIAAPTPTASTGPLLLPLTTLKLTPSARVVFSVADGRLVAHPVEIGDVHGDRIEVLTTLPVDLSIVTDARGLSEGEKVNVATSTP